ncbi:hypothetical protein LZ31DRAFT_140529 [Colletotrichum somersetense]|nr:hypothetical protein LZ31DRAFT_140529 [Colletotrichum somersetense]
MTSSRRRVNLNPSIRADTRCEYSPHRLRMHGVDRTVQPRARAALIYPGWIARRDGTGRDGTMSAGRARRGQGYRVSR